jgi:hypothetical protein
VDTRQKIIPLDEFGRRRQQDRWTAVIGTFDPVTAKVAQTIREHARPDRRLLVVVTPGESPLLSVEARAALMAALRDVTAVAIDDAHHARDELKSMSGVQIIEHPATDRRRTGEFIDLVLKREKLRAASTRRVQAPPEAS